MFPTSPSTCWSTIGNTLLVQTNTFLCDEARDPFNGSETGARRWVIGCKVGEIQRVTGVGESSVRRSSRKSTSVLDDRR